MKTFLIEPKPEDVREIRKALQISQKNMAPLLGYTAGSRVSEVETGAERLSAYRWTVCLLALDAHPTYRLSQR
jgi:predicted transcriptional regulator